MLSLRKLSFFFSMPLQNSLCADFKNFQFFKTIYLQGQTNDVLLIEPFYLTLKIFLFMLPNEKSVDILQNCQMKNK